MNDSDAVAQLRARLQNQQHMLTRVIVTLDATAAMQEVHLEAIKQIMATLPSAAQSRIAQQTSDQWTASWTARQAAGAVRHPDADAQALAVLAALHAAGAPPDGA